MFISHTTQLASESPFLKRYRVVVSKSKVNFEDEGQRSLSIVSFMTCACTLLQC